MGRLRGNNLTIVKKQNESLIREVVYKYAPISRSEIAEMLSLTPPTITTNITAMIEKGQMAECLGGEEEHTLGRPPIKLDFIENACYVVGVELTPYQTVVMLLNLRGKEQASVCYPPQAGAYEEKVFVLAQHIDALIQKSGVECQRILGIGVGIPGFVQREAGIVRKSILRSFNNMPFAKDLGRLTGYPVLLENNARVRAIGEEMFGSVLRPDTFAYFFISYGIACPLYVKNMILEGEQQGAGEAGHMVAVLNGPRCATCGNYGCLEEVASERAILNGIKEEIKKGRISSITKRGKNPDKITIADVLKAQQQGDELAAQTIENAIPFLGSMLANIINFVNPPLVIVDAFLMSDEKNQKYLLRETQSHVFGLYDEDVKIEFVPYSPYSGARGAAALAIKFYLINGNS